MTEPEWSEREQAWMLALGRWRSGKCRCGEQLSVSTDPQYDASNPQRAGKYVVGPPLVCHACAAVTRAQRAFGDESKVVPPEAAIHIPELHMGR